MRRLGVIGLVVGVLAFPAGAWAQGAAHMPGFTKNDRVPVKVRTWCPYGWPDPTTEYALVTTTSGEIASGRSATPSHWIERAAPNAHPAPAWVFQVGHARVWVLQPSPNARVAINGSAIPMVFNIVPCEG